MDTSQVEWTNALSDLVSVVDISDTLYVRAQISPFIGSSGHEWKVEVFRGSPNPLGYDTLFTLDEQAAKSVKEAQSAVLECLEYLDEQIAGRIEVMKEEIQGMEEILAALAALSDPPSPWHCLADQEPNHGDRCWVAVGDHDRRWTWHRVQWDARFTGWASSNRSTTYWAADDAFENKAAALKSLEQTHGSPDGYTRVIHDKPKPGQRCRIMVQKPDGEWRDAGEGEISESGDDFEILIPGDGTRMLLTQLCILKDLSPVAWSPIAPYNPWIDFDNQRPARHQKCWVATHLGDRWSCNEGDWQATNWLTKGSFLFGFFDPARMGIEIRWCDESAFENQVAAVESINALYPREQP